MPVSSPKPADEVERLGSLCRTGLLDTAPDPRFDRVTRLAARLFKVPIAIVSLVDSDRQWFKSAVGLKQGGTTGRDDAFCAHTILDPTRPLIVPDAHDDGRFAANPAVVGDPAIRFYAGAPILDAAGRALGSLCILDTRPRRLRPDQVESLTDLAFGVSVIMQMEQVAVAHRESEEHHRWAVALSPQSQWVADPEGNILEISPRLLRQLGMTVDQVHGDDWIRAVLPEDRARVTESWRQSLLTGEVLDYEFRFCMADGTCRWVRSRAAPRRDEKGRVLRWYGTVEDIDDRKLAELAAEDTRRRLELVLESTNDFVVLYDNDWRATYVNPRMRRVEGYSGLLGNILWDALPELAGTTIEASLLRCKVDGRPVTLETYSIRRKGWIEINAYPSAYGLSMFIRDVNEQHELRERLLHQARHDPLTDLPNRSFLHSELCRRLDGDAGNEAGPLLLRLRLNDFQAATDTFGPTMGEALMREVAGRLTRCVTATCFVARLDGPEFAVLPSPETRDRTPEALAAVLLNAVEPPYALDDSVVRLRPSVGIALAPEDGGTADDLLQAADIAMSRAQVDGQGSYRRFVPAMLQGLADRHQLLLDPREAIARGELRLAYQPLVDFPQGRVGGFEALMRWDHPRRGSVSPAEFISVAEQSGLMVELGEFALRRACEEAGTWCEPVRVAVNLSPTEFRDPGLAAAIARILHETGFPASRLKLEITESVLLEDSDANLRILHQLREFGAEIVLDDFGTGYSSLGYLHRFPFHNLKIDQSFVRSLMQRSESQVIVRSILDLARSLGISATAEGIETEEQLRWLVQAGCGQIQGYLLGRPLPSEQVDSFLRDFVPPRLG